MNGGEQNPFFLILILRTVEIVFGKRETFVFENLVVLV